MPGGLVEPQVDGDHRVQRREHLVELVACGRGQHRVTGDGDQGLDLAVSWGGDLLGQTRNGHLPEYFLGAADAGAEPAELRCPVLQTRYRLHGDRPCGGAGEHGTALDVEVPGQDVHDVDEPAGEAAELLVAGTDPAVDDRARSRGEFARQFADARGVDVGDGGDPFG